MSALNITTMDPPADVSLPLFVYGALKPGMPGHEVLKPFIQREPQKDCLVGELFVRDGLPLLILNDSARTEGFVLTWKSGQETAAYEAVCAFEPRKHYVWTPVKLESGLSANALKARYPNKGNPQPLHSASWKLTDDPAFGEGLDVIRFVNEETRSSMQWNDWERFFRAQMAYLLLWSILERLSALSFGPVQDPTQRAHRLHELDGIAELIREVVRRTDRVADSRDPSTSYVLKSDNPLNCFRYYYQVRSNLSHRGKAVHNEVDKVQRSLDELLEITCRYLKGLREIGGDK